MESENLIVKLSFDFALELIRYTELPENQRKFVVANQLLKAGTSIGANVREAQDAESRADFIHKFKIAAKEANETEYWLMLCNLSDSYPKSPELLEKADYIKRVISKIIISSKSKKI
jgi:four helix bundle protein